ncbi:hypothetical protein Ae201684_006745 [Aphanomyces euteiches]|uniref:FHA domain-containing protein n=1 Tax=Aphanomyces euteiches TaxID=100861 RepID=A0A6G0XBX3_9STRA|nr:hypothetical protein Ae201684_006745 [Aphanomyces euteiches]KAH9133322.1 hypothetical protein AeRB84_020584 [Aphanomyces euteiches]
MALQSELSMNDDFSQAAATAKANGSTVTTYATTFQPPNWIVMPIEASSAVRFEVMRVSKSCGVCELGKKLMSIFGREQDGSDFVLANPSISRKHAAVIHCAKGGVYLVDLMSRHGTFVGKTKIPPHDPFLLHEGDIVTFGQSCRTYVLKGADQNGPSQALKRTWPRLSLSSLFSHTLILRRTSPARKCSDLTTKMVAKICSGSYREDRVKEFIDQVSELDDEQLEEIAILLVEKVRQSYASAHHIVLALLHEKIAVQEFENNLGTIVQVSQTNLEARKILKTIAEARIENAPKTPTESEQEEPEGESSYAPPAVEAYAPPVVPYVPPMPPTQSSEVKSRERVLSDEGKRLFASAINGTSTVVDDEEEKENDNGHSEPPSSSFSFIGAQSAEPATSSAFGFMSKSNSEEEKSQASSEPPLASSSFLIDPSLDPEDFENLWQSAKSSEEWTVEVVSYFNTDLMERCLALYSHVKILASGKVGGVHKFYYYAEQASNGTIFMAEIQVIESMRELSATFKWIELGLLYDDGHLLFIKLFKECLEPCFIVDHPRLATLAQVQLSVPEPVAVSAEPAVPEDGSFAATLSSHPDLDIASFEALWLDATSISELEDPDERDVSGIDSVISQFQAKRLFCLASGSMDNEDKFFFYAEWTKRPWLFFVELSISRPDGALVALCKMYAPDATDEDHEVVAPLFVTLVEDILADLE